MSEKYSMVKPCAGCPFGLHKNAVRHIARMVEIAVHANGFTCHQTTKETGDGSHRECAGYMIFQLANAGPTQMMRIAGRLGMLSEENYRQLEDYAAGEPEYVSIVDMDELIEAHE